MRYDGHLGILIESKSGGKFIIHENEDRRIVIVSCQFISSKWL